MATRRSAEQAKQSGLEDQSGAWELQSSSGDLVVAVEEWSSFLESFSRQHEGWLAGISRPGEAAHAAKWRLQDITTDGGGDGDRIRISLVRNHADHWIHEVKHPLQLTFKRDATGAHQGLDIISSDGLVTNLRFRGAAHPETLDGVLPDKRPPRRAR